jgi:4-amino-4-deoxy-L-arabinose transferase-like glycosyltransferase
MDARRRMIPPPMREVALVALATLVGAAIRLWDLGRLGLDHFDEGIYALGGLWVASPRGLAGLDPGLVPYAPPLYPVLVGVAYLLFGPLDRSAILVSIAAGTATIPLVAHLGRRAFGPGAGAATAWLCALSGPHVAFSRMALTDATALLAFLLALAAGVAFLERPGVLRALLLGLAVGLAQNAKYNGFLAGVVVVLAWVLRAAAEERRRPVRMVALLGTAAGVAALCYLPWYRFVESHGGYADLLRHQRGYVDGPGFWLRNLGLQHIQAITLSGVVARGLSWAGLAGALAWLGVAWVGTDGPDRGRAGLGPRLLVVGMMVPAAWVLGMAPELLWVGGLAALAIHLRDPAPGPRLLAVAALLLLVLTPLYRPYARLALPLHALAWIGLARPLVLLHRELAAHASGGPLLPVTRRFGLLSIVAMGLVLLGRIACPPGVAPSPTLMDPRDGLREALDDLARADRAHGRSPTRVYARPPVLFYLSTWDDVFRRAPSLDALLAPPGPNETAIADSLLLRQELSLEEARRRVAASRWSASVRVQGTASLPTRLDATPFAEVDRNDAWIRETQWSVYGLLPYRPHGGSAPGL